VLLFGRQKQHPQPRPERDTLSPRPGKSGSDDLRSLLYPPPSLLPRSVFFPREGVTLKLAADAVLSGLGICLMFLPKPTSQIHPIISPKNTYATIDIQGQMVYRSYTLLILKKGGELCKHTV